MNKVYLGLGSNVGVKDANISSALEALQNHSDISLVQISTQYETHAVSQFVQPNYINCAAEISTFLTPLELLDVTESIERDLGRTSKSTGDPRIIDIDILLYNNEIIALDRLTIPHTFLHERLFVLDPLHEIAPDFLHPLLNQTISELRSALHGY